MSPRRRSGLSPEDLQALKHLPAVLTALEHLQEQHAKVRALMGPGPIASITGPRPWGDVLKPPTGLENAKLQRDAAVRTELGNPAGSPTLDTPERRAYEEAKRSGTTIPDVDPLKDPLRNASDAQRERMAEQRALIAAERQRKGMPPSRGLAPSPPVEEEASVRTEELPTSVNGSTGAEEEPNA